MGKPDTEVARSVRQVERGQEISPSDLYLISIAQTES
jgi:hypothetical protein